MFFQVVATALFASITDYLNTCIAVIFRKEGHKALIMCGVFTQIGSLIAALITFVLINVLELFHAKYPCTWIASVQEPVMVCESVWVDASNIFYHDYYFKHNIISLTAWCRCCRCRQFLDIWKWWYHSNDIRARVLYTDLDLKLRNKLHYKNRCYACIQWAYALCSFVIPRLSNPPFQNTEDRVTNSRVSGQCSHAMHSRITVYVNPDYIYCITHVF